MKLFFETTSQWPAFLLTLPIGFLLAFGVEFEPRSPNICFWFDLMLLVLGGAGLLSFCLFFPFSSLRLFHLLGLITGAILYLEGISRVREVIARKKKHHSGRNDTKTCRTH